MSAFEQGANAKYCQACGKPLPDRAAFCPQCGAAVQRAAANSTTPPHAAQATLTSAPIEDKNREPLVRIALATVGLLVVLSGIAFYVHRSIAQHSAFVRAESSYDALASRLAALTNARSSIHSSLQGTLSSAETYYSDFQKAYDLGQQRHAEGEGADNLSTMHSLAQEEQADINDAQQAQSIVESDDATLVASITELYGATATRQLQSDLAARNEARDNSVTEWQRAIALIIDNLTASMRFQAAPYDNSDIVSHYTASARDGNDATRYSGLSVADLAVLQHRLNSDILSVQSQMRTLKSTYPTIR